MMRNMSRGITMMIIINRIGHRVHHHRSAEQIRRTPRRTYRNRCLTQRHSLSRLRDLLFSCHPRLRRSHRSRLNVHDRRRSRRPFDHFHTQQVDDLIAILCRTSWFRCSTITSPATSDLVVSFSIVESTRRDTFVYELSDDAQHRSVTLHAKYSTTCSTSPSSYS